MKAIISGQYGTAVLIEGSAYSSIDIDSEGETVPRNVSDVRHLLSDASDAYVIKSTTKEHAIAELERAWKRDRTLQLLLILLDHNEESQTRRDAAECLEEFLSSESERENAASVLYAMPLPDSSVAEQSLSFVATNGHAHRFLEKLIQDQPSITLWCKEWNSVTREFCEGLKDRKSLTHRAVRSGAFRIFVEEEGRGDSALLRLLLNKEFKGSSLGRRVLTKWAAKFRSAVSNSDFPVNILPESDDITDAINKRGKRKPKGIHTVFTGVQGQQDGIRSLLNEGRRELALKSTNELIDWQRTNSEPEHISKSLCLLAQYGKGLGDYSWQLILSRRAVQEKQNDAWAHAQVGDALKSLGEYDEAIKSYEAAGYYGDEKIAMTGRAEILRENGQIDEAMSILETCSSQYPEDPVAYCVRAACLASIGRLEDSATLYRETLTRFKGTFDDKGEPVNLRILESALAHVLGEIGQYDEAFTILDRLICRNPFEDVPRCARASLLRDVGELEKAKSAFKDITESMPHSLYARNGYARTLRDLGLLENALDEYSFTAQRYQNDRYSSLGKADVLKRLGRLDDAMWVFQECHAKNPKLAAARNGMASIYAAKGNYEQALDMLSDYEPSTYSDWVGTHIRGTIYMAMGDVERAIQLYKKGLVEVPWLNLKHSLRAGLAGAKLRQHHYHDAAKLLIDIPRGPVWPIAKLFQIHAHGMLDDAAQVKVAHDLLARTCPPALYDVRETLVSRFIDRHFYSSTNDAWLYYNECRSLFLAV